MLKVNETPVKTARNFEINNIELKDIEIPTNLKKFDTVVEGAESCLSYLMDDALSSRRG